MKITKIDDKEYVPKEDYDKLKEEKSLDIKSSDFYCHEPSNVMLMGKIDNVDAEKFKLKFVDMEFVAVNTNITVLFDIQGDGETLDIMRDGKKWSRISKLYYDKAKKIINEWAGNCVDIHVQEKKNLPVMIRGEDLAFILAPRVEDEDD